MNNREVIDYKRMNRGSGTCGTLTNDLTFMTSGSQRERRKGVGFQFNGRKIAIPTNDSKATGHS